MSLAITSCSARERRVSILPRNEYSESPIGRDSYRHIFVELLPEKLEDGILYVSMRYATAVHNCFCGCGREVVTPIHPTKWQLGFDGVKVSLFPSVGNWSLPCQSHYVLRGGRILCAESLSKEEINAVRARDLAAQSLYWEQGPATPSVSKEPAPAPEPVLSHWQVFLRWIGKR
jgi:hypothetical protein